MIWTSPLRRSISAGAEPRYGTWRMSTPVMNLKSSAARCDVDPIPPDAKFSLPGLALA